MPIYRAIWKDTAHLRHWSLGLSALVGLLSWNVLWGMLSFTIAIAIAMVHSFRNHRADQKPTRWLLLNLGLILGLWTAWYGDRRLLDVNVILLVLCIALFEIFVHDHQHERNAGIFPPIVYAATGGIASLFLAYALNH